MRRLARKNIEAAAVKAGIDNIIDKPAFQSKVILPLPRLEFETLPSKEKRNPRLFAILPTGDPKRLIYRIKTHDIELKTRIVIRVDAKNESTLEPLKKTFLQSLPGKCGDENDNLVTVSPQQAQYGGFEHRIVEVMKERSVAIWILFHGGLYEDKEINYLTDVHITGINYKYKL
ncbi:conserved hypothetical protein [Candidatus Magnetomoraceae bacterium gMMP-15]